MSYIRKAGEGKPIFYKWTVNGEPRFTENADNAAYFADPALAQTARVSDLSGKECVVTEDRR